MAAHLHKQACHLDAAGRDLVTGRRHGPRPLDLDIVFFGGQDVQHEALSIPHIRWGMHRGIEGRSCCEAHAVLAPHPSLATLNRACHYFCHHSTLSVPSG